MQIPMLVEGNAKILGGQNVIVLYLCKGYKRIEERLYQREFRMDIDKHLAYFQARMKPNTFKLTRMIIQP